MARPRTIHVDADSLLAGIKLHTNAEIQRLSKCITRGTDEWEWEAEYEWNDIADHGVRVNLVAFVGRELSASERIRHQQALRRLEAAGLVAIYGKRATRVALTESGDAHLQTLQAARTPAVGVCSQRRTDSLAPNFDSSLTADGALVEGPVT